MKALITGSGGLIGSECSRQLCDLGWEVVGVDNDMRAQFFGEAGTTRPVVRDLIDRWPAYRHCDLDIRNRQGVRNLLESERPDFLVHTAAQPSHDKAAAIPYDDFDVNAAGTLNLLVAARDFCRETPFCFTSTNKVYGDRPNFLPLVEMEKRYDYSGGLDGIDEAMSIDGCLHSVFGASKVAADVMCQEFGRYFNMPVGIFRGGCLTGPMHAAVELHGYLAYIVHCAVHDFWLQREAGARSNSRTRRGVSVFGVLPAPTLRRGLQPGRRPEQQHFRAGDHRYPCTDGFSSDL
jgi:CDP-paratose 2-epimerase